MILVRTQAGTISTLFVVVVLMSGASGATYGGGTGTAADPYLISTREDLFLLAESQDDLDKSFRMTNDIDMEGSKKFYPLIGAGLSAKSFSGVFDGCGHVIRNLVINEGGEFYVGKYVGLFGCVEGDLAEIKNVGLEDCSITGQGYVGGLVGTNMAKIEGCFVNGIVVSKATPHNDGWLQGCGSLVGQNNGTITNCYTTGTVKGISWGTGGLAGMNAGEITYCCSLSTVSGTATSLYVGGLVGHSVNADAMLSCCYATGTVTGGLSVGGLVGNNAGSVVNCYATGDVIGVVGSVGKQVGTVGGLIGVSNGIVTNCYAAGSVTGPKKSIVKGLVGEEMESKITSCFYDNTNIAAKAKGKSKGKTKDKDSATGMATEQLKQRSTFESAGWDFAGSVPVWDIKENQSYPELVGMPKIEN